MDPDEQKTKPATPWQAEINRPVVAAFVSNVRCQSGERPFRFLPQHGIRNRGRREGFEIDLCDIADDRLDAGVAETFLVVGLLQRASPKTV